MSNFTAGNEEGSSKPTGLGMQEYKPSTTNNAGHSGRGKGDVGALNLSLVLFAAIGGLSCFLSYLIWQSFASAAPTVLRTDAQFSREHKFSQDYESDIPQVAVRPSAESIPRTLPAVEDGERLYRNIGCILCHGPEGRGGVKNPNYIKETFPPLDQIASRLFLEYEEDAEVIIDLLSSGLSLEQPSGIDVPGARRIAAGYQSVSNVILKGNPAGRKDDKGSEPIYMPAYEDLITKSEMNDMIAYCLTLYPWEEEEEWEEDQ